MSEAFWRFRGLDPAVAPNQSTTRRFLTEMCGFGLVLQAYVVRRTDRLRL